MEIIRTFAMARAGLLGNPSDGYHGKTISLCMTDYKAKVVLYKWPEIEIILTRQDQCRFDTLEDLSNDVRLHGYYGGLRLIKATIKSFHEYVKKNNLHIPDKKFSIRYDTDIPRGVGLAGSSAIITATMKALALFYNVDIDKKILPGLILDVEQDELGITAGLQDRVAQVYEGLVYMDFDEKLMKRGYGEYINIDPSLLPPVYIAFMSASSEVSEVPHANLRMRYEAGEKKVVESMRRLALLAEKGYEALLGGNKKKISDLVNENFDIRRGMCEIRRDHCSKVETARRCGASAKFAGSGGAIIGTCPEGKTWDRLCTELRKTGCRVFRPGIAGIR